MGFAIKLYGVCLFPNQWQWVGPLGNAHQSVLHAVKIALSHHGLSRPLHMRSQPKVVQL